MALSFLLTSLLLPALTTSTLLYSTHYSGQLATLQLTQKGYGSYSLAVTSNITACGEWPSWVTYSNSERKLYCSGEEYWPNGTLSVFDVGKNGELAQQAKIETMGGGVNSIFYGEGSKWLAIAHYHSFSISTFKLPITSSSKAQQVFTYSLAKPGPNPQRQEAPHPHQVLLDPSGRFLLSVDLGADLIRIFDVNSESGQLTECPSYQATPGSGPRHAAFWTPLSQVRRSDILLQEDGLSIGGGGVLRRGAAKPPKSAKPARPVNIFLANELTNSVSALQFFYPDPMGGSKCPTIEEYQTISSYPPGFKIPTPTPQIGEIRVKGNTVYVTNRNDDTFGVGKDSMITFDICSETHTLKQKQFISSEAEWPRTLSITEKGDLAVVGGQVSSDVVVFERNIATGELGKVVARAVTGKRGDTNGNGGMSGVFIAE